MTLTFGNTLSREDKDGIFDVTIEGGAITRLEVYIPAIDEIVPVPVDFLTNDKVQKIMDVYWQALDASEAPDEDAIYDASVNAQLEAERVVG